jgi:hypothetical protein
MLFNFRYQSQHEHNETELTYKAVAKQDPQAFVLYGAVAFILLSSIHIAIYSHEGIWNFLSKLNWTLGRNHLETNNGQKYKNYQEAKNIVVGAGSTFVAVTMIALFVVPLFMARQYLHEDENGINFGMGRTWTYIGRMTMPVLSFLILPSVIIVNNHKMRTVLIREFEDMIVSINKR